MLADIIVVIHLLIVVFIVGGVPVVYLGVALGWVWVRRPTWRAVHLGAILFVAAEPLLGIACPLTVWEDALRGAHQRAGFIERCIHPVMFYQAPTWVFTTVYLAFAVLVLGTWIAVPPIRDRPRSL
jgi:polyferredoxin